MSSNSTELDETNDLLVAFPSDVLGCQAFYNIVENIIRNTAKYNKQNTKEITFNINIKDVIYLDGYVQGLPSEYNQYYAVEIDDGINVNKIDELVTKQNMRLNESILGDEQRLRKHSLGLWEMEASAAFLRQIDLHEIESDDYNISQNTSFFNYKMNLNILKAFKANGNALGYRFFIKKPQEFLFVVDWEINDEQKKMLMNKGIWFKTEADLKKDLEKGIVYAHRFVVADKTEDKFFADNNLSTQKYEYKTLLPSKW